MDFHKKLKEKGLKATPQRLLILDIISKNGHIDIEEIYKRVNETIPTISIATVYKNIKTLEEKGLISEVNIASFRTLYELNTQRHIHFVCTECKKILDIAIDETRIKKMLTEVLDLNLTPKQVDIILYGLCKDCEQKG